MIEDELKSIGGQIGGHSRSLAIVVASLHNAGVIDGFAIARSIRLDAPRNEDAKEQQLALADLIRRTIDAGPQPPLG